MARLSNKFIKFALSSIAAASIFAGATNINTNAQSLVPAPEVVQQSNEQTIVRTIFFKSFPPYQYYYNDGVYRGYLFRVEYGSLSDGTYYGVYAGTITNGPVPLPTKVEEEK